MPEHGAVSDYRQALRERGWRGWMTHKLNGEQDWRWKAPGATAYIPEAEAFAMLSAEMGPGVQAGQAEREEAMRDD